MHRPVGPGVNLLNKNINKKIVIVGGGTAGYVAALMLNAAGYKDVSLIYSDKIGIVGVGEGSTEHFFHFMDLCKINFNDVINECDATYKAGIMFQGWGERTYLHNIGTPYSEEVDKYFPYYGKLISENEQMLHSLFLYENHIPSWIYKRPDTPVLNQLHFNTYKLNNFFMKISMERGITVLEDSILDVKINELGEIKYLIGEKGEHHYDFYIDATGQKRLLINKLGAKWNSFNKFLKMKSAVVFPTGDEDNYNLWTLSKAMNYGWMFKIPTWGRHGNGYIFDSDYISSDQAKKELDIYFGKDVEIKKSFNFDPGYVSKPWIKNCLAVGLSSSFVEPLEATSIGTTIQQMFLFIHNYPSNNYNNYNDEFEKIMINILDFVALHYVTNNNFTNFWSDVSKIKLPESLNDILNNFSNKLPCSDDFNHYGQYKLFDANNFIVVMHGLSLFNTESIRKNHIKKYKDSDDRLTKLLMKQRIFEKSNNKISHKEYIGLVRGEIKEGCNET